MTIKETSDELVWQLLAQLPAGEWLMTHDRTNVMQVREVLALLAEHESAEAQPTRNRLHVGYRVVRERDGVREWWNVAIGGWSRHPPSAGWREVRPNRGWVTSVGGRVVKVFLSYSDETRNGRGR